MSSSRRAAARATRRGTRSTSSGPSIVSRSHSRRRPSTRCTARPRGLPARSRSRSHNRVLRLMSSRCWPKRDGRGDRRSRLRTTPTRTSDGLRTGCCPCTPARSAQSPRRRRTRIRWRPSPCCRRRSPATIAGSTSFARRRRSSPSRSSGHSPTQGSSTGTGKLTAAQSSPAASTTERHSRSPSRFASSRARRSSRSRRQISCTGRSRHCTPTVP
jgi:hypothetical protein